jgi:hypothetical protein
LSQKCQLTRELENDLRSVAKEVIPDENQREFYLADKTGGRAAELETAEQLAEEIKLLWLIHERNKVKGFVANQEEQKERKAKYAKLADERERQSQRSAPSAEGERAWARLTPAQRCQVFAEINRYMADLHQERMRVIRQMLCDFHAGRPL